MKNRIQLISQTNFEMHILLKKKWSIIIFCVIWLAGWTAGGIAVIIDIGTNPTPFMIIWFIVWLLGELFVLYALLWNAFGKEIIKQLNNKIVLKNDILGFGFSKKYEIKKISNVRASGYFGTPDMFNLVVWNIVGGTIAFDYEGKTIRFGIALEEAEAKEAENILNNYLKK
ncbi:MAG TPA: hypothetical protein PLZ38_08900 [Spirochaetota bacterium]|nr:hypothetical protein [Spirochaetota bacterium]HRV32646.1 hypothetical protein [Candidatus Paceibacterota bacterium]HOR94076.1 hypothetical protein [Spirochaetota bacterium]HPK44512.1 hypothetical protein [Spirochaetota bacterium]HQG43323.1 hypothetical protein [Spirochaetota bacterium]